MPVDLGTPPQTEGYVPKLGRLFAEDKNDRKFLLPRPPRLATLPTYKYWMSLGKPLDQGDTSACVGFAVSRYLTSHPVCNHHRPMTPYALYYEAQKLDEWPGQEPQYYGTSVRAGMRLLKLLKRVEAYHWAFDLETVVAHLLSTGPVVMGTDWHRSMWEADPAGYIWPTGPVDGGHAWLLLGANRKRKNPDGTVGAVQMINSWGSSFGSNGRAWLTFDALEQLIAQYGEAAVAKEVKA